MASATHLMIQLPPLKKQSLSQLIARARRLGIEPGDYARTLIEEGLAIEREAKETSFAQIMRPVRDASGDVGDAEITRLVEAARTRRLQVGRRKKR